MQWCLDSKVRTTRLGAYLPVGRSSVRQHNKDIFLRDKGLPVILFASLIKNWRVSTWPFARWCILEGHAFTRPWIKRMMVITAIVLGVILRNLSRMISKVCSVYLVITSSNAYIIQRTWRCNDVLRRPGQSGNSIASQIFRGYPSCSITLDYIEFSNFSEKGSSFRIYQ